MKPIVVYTGTKSWVGPPIIQAARKGRVEHGPGLYFTTSLQTARKYAKGRGAVLRVEIDPNLTWIEGAVTRTDLLVRWVYEQRGLRHKEKLVADIIERGPRGLPGEGDISRVSTLVNLMVNYEAIKGAQGPALAAFLVSLGIDAAHVSQSGNEEWVVLFNPKKIRSWREVTAQDEWDLPSVRRR